MGAAIRAFEHGSRLGERFLRDLGSEFREARIALGLSQAHVALASRMPRVRYCHVEAGTVPSLSIIEVARTAAVLGLDPMVRLYPGGAPIRDRAHAERLRRLLSAVRSPLLSRTEVPLPSIAGRRELRAWDAMLLGHGERTAVELEMRLRDSQAAERRISLKRRDDPTEHFVLAIADTRTNRRVLATLGGGIANLSRVRSAAVFAAFAAGTHPPTGYIFV
jgi:transcriptional regulator with XRE-family HTH domain